jgi:arsenate reductase-like glutaredoxin family protein
MAFFEVHGCTVRETVNARKEKKRAPEALALLGGLDRLIAVRGKKRVEVDLKTGTPLKEELLKVLLGPTGNLRAPTLRLGKILLVGFQEETYLELLGD